MSKILIIDDERDLVVLLAKKLRTNGHEVFTAYDGHAGAELAQRELPDLILLDIMMPEMDGFDVCRAIRDEVLCPILFLSARQAESDKIQGLTLGGDDYITKPFGMRELMAKIEANLRRERRAQGGWRYAEAAAAVFRRDCDRSEGAVCAGGRCAAGADEARICGGGISGAASGADFFAGTDLRAGLGL